MEIVGIVISVLFGIGGILYGVHAKRQSDATSKGAMLGAEECPRIMPLLSQNGYSLSLRSESDFPHFDIWVRVHDFAVDKIIDPTIIGPAALSDPMFKLPDLYPNHAHGQPFFEIDLRQNTRARLNLFVHTRNSQSSVQIVAIRNGEDKKLAYFEQLSENNENLRIPDDFPIQNPDDPRSLFNEDETTGTLYMKSPDGLVPMDHEQGGQAHEGE
tara:strand:+ start:358 stop:999 length:642 start_codon:yes stop_codon:yes gene_type:complete